VPRVEHDGVGLWFEAAGSGGVPIVLIHGIACDHRYLAPQLEHFARTRRVVAMDLRGHGRSDAPEQEYTIEGFAKDVAWLCGKLSLERPVIVGHSLGGLVALQLAAEGELPSALVALDSVIIPPPGREALMGELFSRLRTPAYEDELKEHFSAFFAPGDDPERRRWILEEVVRAPRHAVISAWESGSLQFDDAAAARACRVPFLYIDAGTLNADLAALAELCPSLVVGRTVGAGHFLQLEVPDQVNAMIERFLAVP
jgi:pimeloyl-ACP methyl ester carboxylesterase